MKKTKKNNLTKEKLRIMMLENVKYWSFAILLLSIVMFILSIFLSGAVSTTAFLLGGIVLFIVWILVYFTIEEKVRKLRG
ncbi:MAG: hypothetical protein ABIG93_03475 [archaeon]|nr:hypothetical protein [Nanoarchaeota archaeon]